MIGNGVSLDASIPTALPLGGNALRLAGSNDYVETIFPGILGDNARSLSFWINRDADVDPAVISYGRNIADEKWVTRRNNNAGDGTDGAIRTELNGGFEIGSTVIPTGTWQHVVMTWEGTNINQAKYYVDSVLETNTGDNGQNVNSSGTNPLQIGNDRFTGSRDWDGMIDDLAIFDSVLTQPEITALWNGSTSPADFLTAAPPTVVFRTGFEYAAGNPTVSGDNAAQLNGADDQIGAFEGAVPAGQGSGLGGPDLFFFKTMMADDAGDQTLAVDRAVSNGSFDAVLTNLIGVDGADVAFELGSIRTATGNRNKDYAIIGLDRFGNESFHLLVNTQNTSGERLSVLSNGGTAIDNLLTVFGADAAEDLNNVSTNALEAQEFANIQLLLQDDGYEILFSRTGSGGRTYRTELLDYNGSAETLSRIRFAFAGSTDNNFNSGFHIDNLSVRGLIVPEPSTLALSGFVLLGFMLSRRRRRK